MKYIIIIICLLLNCGCNTTGWQYSYPFAVPPSTQTYQNIPYNPATNPVMENLRVEELRREQQRQTDAITNEIRHQRVMGDFNNLLLND